MLISKLNFKMQYLFPVTDKPEMTGFNNPCMNWSHSHFMKFFTFDIEKRIICHFIRLILP